MNKQQLLNELRREGFSELILKAFEKVERERFIPEHLKEYAYRNEPLPIGKGSTISQPYTIAFMLNLLELDKISDSDNKNLVTDKNKLIEDSSRQERSRYQKTEKYDIINGITNKNKIKILEIGSGSGYVLALINEILKILKIKEYEIYGIEINKELVASSSKLFKKNKKIKVICGDGSKGLEGKKPFDRIIVSAAFEKIPENLFTHLKENGILVTPVENSIFQFKKIKGKIKSKEFPGFVFVPVVED